MPTFYTIKLRRSTSTDWTTVNPILDEGEPGVELDTDQFKFGDGVTHWNDLPYAVAPVEDNPTGYVARQDFVATAGQTAFTLDLSDADVFQVTLNGLNLDPADYTLVGTTLTLDDPAVIGDGVSVFWNSDGTPPPAGVYVGPEGPPGPQGEQGLIGASGANGTNGANGVDATRGPVTINDQTGTAYTLILADAIKWIRLNNAAAITLTIPTNAAVAFPIGTQIEGNQAGAGQVTIVGDTGVTVNSTPGLKVAAQYGVFGLLKVATNTWLAYGALSA